MTGKLRYFFMGILVTGLLLLAFYKALYHGIFLSEKAHGSALVEKSALELSHKHIKNSLTAVTHIIGQNSKLAKDSVTGTISADHPKLIKLLGSIKKKNNAAMVYLMNREGTVTACTPYGNGKTLTGKNYAFRPYFKEAIIGRDYTYCAVGVTTHKRGIYFSSPITAPLQGNGKPGDPIGVMVIKVGLSGVDSFLSTKTDPCALVSPDGFIFAANQPEWLFRCLAQDSPDLDDSSQFTGKADSQPIFARKPQPNSTITYKDRSYVSVYSDIDMYNHLTGWRLLLLHDINRLLPTWLEYSMRFLIYAFLACSALLGLLILSSFKLRMSQQLVTTALPVFCICLLITLSIFFLLTKLENKRLLSHYNEYGEIATASLERTINACVNEIEGMNRVFQAARQVAPAAFSAHSLRNLRNMPALHKIEWVERRQPHPPRAAWRNPMRKNTREPVHPRGFSKAPGRVAIRPSGPS